VKGEKNIVLEVDEDLKPELICDLSEWVSFQCSYFIIIIDSLKDLSPPR